MRFRYRSEVEKELAKDPGIRRELKKRADRIVEDTRTHARMAAVGHRYEPLDAKPTEKGMRVAAHGPFAAIDEWGSVNSAPTAAMRRAAARAGRFEEA